MRIARRVVDGELAHSYDDVNGDVLALGEIDESIRLLCGRLANGEDANA